ncbi:MAG: hypothetical protein H0X29_04520 [Parachlamydiaceae bacterium]|nr:hypothetical protein [Parachlamydiaceae bacterium]
MPIESLPQKTLNISWPQNPNTYYLAKTPQENKTKKTDTKTYNVIGNTLFCRNGTARKLTSTVPHVCLINFHVEGAIEFDLVDMSKNCVALHQGSSIGDPFNTNAKIFDLSQNILNCGFIPHHYLA